MFPLKLADIIFFRAVSMMILIFKAVSMMSLIKLLSFDMADMMFL